MKITDDPREQWIEARLGQLGIDVRQSKHYVEMRFYLKLLAEEIRMTEEFLRSDGYDLPGLSPNYENYPP